jgi:hypothetical protein
LLKSSAVAGGAIQRSPSCADARDVVEQKAKRPGSLRNPGLREQSLEVVRLGAGLPRIEGVLVPIKQRIAGWDDRMRGRVARAQRSHRRGTDERDRTRKGSGGSDDVHGFHDEAFAMKEGSVERTGGL